MSNQIRVTHRPLLQRPHDQSGAVCYQPRMQPLTDLSHVSDPRRLVGTWRRFGEIGPVYEVIAVASPLANKPMMRIRVLESGEELAYPLGHLLNDPRAT